MSSLSSSLLCAVCCALLLLGGSPARAGCVADVAAWAQRGPAELCALEVLVCPPGGVVVLLPAGSAPPLRVELRSDGGHSFRAVRGLSLSPVVEVEDWSRANPDQRAAFERFARCLERHPEPLPFGEQSGVQSGKQSGAVVAGPSPATPARRLPITVWPFRMLAGLVLAWLSVAAASRPRRERPVVDRFVVESIAALLVLPGLTIAAWRLLWAHGFLHQNGQGPLWVQYAVDPATGRSPYGPGYAEVFHGLASLWPANPEVVIFAATTVACALIAPAAWLVARHAGAGPWTRWLLALCIAALPPLGRMAQSQSYYPICTALLAFAAVPLCLSPSLRASPRARLGFVCGALAAGLLIAQAARIHPICWTAAACLPLVMLARPSPPRARLVELMLAALVVALVVGVSTGPALLAALHENIATRWAPTGARHLLALAALPAALGLAAAAAFVWLPPRGAAFALAPALALGGLLLVIPATSLVEASGPLIMRCFELLYLPALLGPVLGLLMLRPSISRPSLLLLAAACALYVQRNVALARRLTTDEQEQAFVASLRTGIKDSPQVAFLSRAGDHVLFLPLYGSPSRPGPSPFPIDPARVPPRPPPGVRYYYRSSLCAAPEGREACAAIARDWPLEAVTINGASAERTLEANVSHPRFRLDGETVSIGLYRVDAGPAPK